MIISNPPTRAFVWVWLPAAVTPVVAGVITSEAGKYVFTYGQSYLARADAIALFEPELPLISGPQIPTFSMASCLRDGAPDAWGRRVIINRLTGEKGRALDALHLDELTFLLESGSDRIGGLDFQHSPESYVARETGHSTLDALAEAADLIEQGVLLPPVLAAAIQHGSSIGGARPKALIDDPLNGKKYIAKFSAANDTYSVVKAEFIAMRLASLTGLSVAGVKLTRSLGKDVLLIERFDRTWESAQHQWSRRIMVSALTLLGLSEDIPQYASYPDLAALIRKGFSRPQQSLRELYGRMVFNVLVGNTDDHARNHSAFWNGHELQLTPAYDICPQARAGQEATQAMLLTEQSRFSQLQVCLAAAAYFHLSPTAAEQVIVHQLAVIARHWEDVCKEAQISAVDKALLTGNQFLNPFAFYGLPADSLIRHPWR